MPESREEWEKRHPRLKLKTDPFVDNVLNRMATYSGGTSYTFKDKAARDAMLKVQQLVGDINIRIITTEFDPALALVVSLRDKLREAEVELQKLAREKHSHQQAASIGGTDNAT
jgi:hypothetical protein